MARRKKTVAKVEEEELETLRHLNYATSDDEEDNEANKDLSLEIVDRARSRMGNNPVEIGRTTDPLAAPVNINNPLLFGGDKLPRGGKEKMENLKKKKKKKKTNKDKDRKDEDVYVMKAEVLLKEDDVGAEAIRIFDNDIMEEERLVTVENVDLESIGIFDNATKVEKCQESITVVDTEAIGISDNVVLRKLLRGPRYFDTPNIQSKTCYNCGQEGHMGANCKEEKRKKPCFVCGKFGHVGKQCTQVQDCYICKRRGHLAKNCLEKNKGSLLNLKICLRCGDLGHHMSSCRNNYASDDLKEIRCYVCKNFGHLCCVNIIDADPGEVSCYNCGQSGHTGFGCANVRGEMNDVVSPTLCYKCGEEGHFARGCTKSVKPGRWTGKPSTPALRSSKQFRDLGFQSAPTHADRVHKRKTKSFEGRKYKSSGKSRHRGGWLTDDLGDLSKRKVKVRSWMSPGTPAKKDCKRSTFAAGGDLLSSQSPIKKHKILVGTPSTHVSSKQLKRGFSDLRSHNSRGHFGRI